ncbi:MFS transporter [Streptomyces sp. NBC_01511]|uniref:MFS transporter n=1 Tax=unclassified Streptomyces TaxID=2593676 RepID=UPI00386A7725
MFRIQDPFLRGQLATAALFSALGFQYATWASRIPTFKADLDLTSAEVGFFLMAAGIGAAVSFPLVAHLMRRLGSQRLALLSTLGLTLMLLGLALAPNYPTALLVMGVDGVLVGCLNTAMNAQGAALETTFERNTMAKLHATFSGGSLAAALLASGMNAVTSSVVAHFGVAALLLVLLAVCARGGLLADEGSAAAEEKTTRPRTRWTLPTGVTLWMCCAMAFGTVAEGAMNDWSTLYMEDVALASEQVAPLGIAVVSGMMVVARLFADGWRSRWGDGRVVVLGSVLAGVGLGAALLAGGVVPALLGFGAVGLGVAAVTPCVYVAAAKRGSDTLTLVAAMGTTGLLAGPPIIGFVANASSLAWGLGLVCVCAFVVTLCGSRIPWEAVAHRTEPQPDRA